MPFMAVLGLLFITLKLTGHIAWAWIWVLAPFWIGLAIFAVIMLILGITGGFASSSKRRF